MSKKHQGAKGNRKRSIKIKPFRQPPKLPPQYYASTSEELFKATSAILRNSSSSSSSSSMERLPSLQSCYTQVVNLVSHQYGPQLYKDLIQEFQSSCQFVLPESCSFTTAASDAASMTTTAATPQTSALQFLTQQYPKYVNYLILVRHVFMALDRPYVYEETTSQNNTNNGNNATPPGIQIVKRTSQTMTLLEVGLKQFQKRLVQLGWISLLHHEWWTLLWESFSTQTLASSHYLLLLQTTMSIWKDLGMARSMVHRTQQPLVQALVKVSDQYKAAGTNYNAIQYLEYIHNKHHSVAQSWSAFLPKSWLRTLLERYLLEPHLNEQWLLRDIDITQTTHLQKLCQLASRLPSQQGSIPVLDALCRYTRSRGLSYIQAGLETQQQQQSQRPNNNNSGSAATFKTCISGLLKLHDELTALQTYIGDLPLKPVWTEILNQDSPTAVAEWLAKYIDAEFKSRQLNDSDVSNQLLQPLLHLFSHLAAKDVFEAFYKKDLAKRLLQKNKIHSMDMERQFVSLLKAECGAGYTSKMEGMFEDVAWSRESQSQYKQHLQQQQTSAVASLAPFGIGAVDMEVQILTTGYWPVYPQYPHLILPPELSQPQDQFWQYYKQKYQGRKIAWQYALGQCVVKYNFQGQQQQPSKTYELVVSLCQTLVLLCFNLQAEWSIPELAQKIGLDMNQDWDTLERVLVSLCLGKETTRILKRSKKSATPAATSSSAISATDVLFLNPTYSSPMRRVKIGNMFRRETKQERDKVVEAISRDRLYLIDAVLVRILKARKTIMHAQLIPQVLDHVKVPVQIADIKKRIESLIEREYMERDANDRNRYNYLA